MKILSALGLLIGAVLIFLALSGQLDYHLYSASQQVVGGIRSASSPNSKISTVKPSLEKFLMIHCRFPLASELHW
jgi:hypothetical protein